MNGGGDIGLFLKGLVILYILFSLLLLPYGYNCLFLVYASRKYKARKPKKIHNIPFVTIQLPLYNERYVARRLIESVGSLKWPISKLQILVLDDSTDETSEIVKCCVEQLKLKGHDIGILNRDERTGYKAGALQNALKYSKGKYIAIFDADFLPPPDFLNETIALMEDDPILGIVQTRWGHINRRYNRFTQAFAIGIDGHHIVEQTGRSALGLLMNFNGSCGVLRKEAIIDAGGWHHDTLSEDMDLSYRIQLKGWKAIYLRDTIVKGEIPPGVVAFRNQQSRWAHGSIQCSRKLIKEVWRSEILSKAQKIEATIHLTYYLIHPIMLLTLIISVPLLITNSFGSIPFLLPYGFMLGVCAMSSFSMYYTALNWQKIKMRTNIINLTLLCVIGYGLSARCTISVMKGIHKFGGVFERTPKYDIRKRHDDWRSKTYKPLRDFLYLDLFFTLYSFIGVIAALLTKVWPMAFYLSVYFFGYLIISYYLSVPSSLHVNR